MSIITPTEMANSIIKIMDEGLLDDVPLRNKERDEAWEAFIKRKDVKKMFLDDKEFSFPLNGAYYDLWSICWAKAWDKGFHTAVEKFKDKNT